MKIHHAWVGYRNAPTTVYVCHGILGSLNNWRSFCVRLHRLRPDLRFVLVDLRNHGRSPASNSENTVRACAEDLIRLGAEIGEPDILIGHSFSGKVVLDYATLVQPSQVWALDSPPGAKNDPHMIREVQKVIAALWEIPMPISERRHMREALLLHGFSKSIAEWMVTNLRHQDGGFIWKFHLSGVEEMLKDYFNRDFWGVVETPPQGTQVRVVRAERSDRWSQDDLRRLSAVNGPNSQVQVLPRAGHWLHVDNHAGLQLMLSEGILRL